MSRVFAWSTCWSALAVMGAALVLSVAAPSPGQATTRLGESPHGRADACEACHLPPSDATAVTPGAVRPVVETCRGCHPDADMHPVGMAPRSVHVADGWPLEDGKVTCATCHAEPSCDPARATVPPWFRDGNPARTTDFCYRCHTPAVLERSNPHVSTADGADSACSACHTGTPTPGAPVAEARLRADPAEACATCHPGPVHAGAAEHVGAVQPTALADDVAKRLPLGDGGTIACWTCHDVHETAAVAPGHPAKKDGIAARILAAERAAAGTEPDRGAPTALSRSSLLALPVSDNALLCKACHGRGP